MRYLGRKLLLLIAVFMVIAYFIILTHGLVTFPAGSIMKVYLWPWAMANALAGMVDAFIPVTVTAILIGFGFFFSADTGTRGLPFSKIVSSPVVLFLFLALVFTVLAEGFAPGIRGRLEEYRGNSSFARSSLREGDQLMRMKEYDEAILYYDYYLSIDPDDEEVIEKRENAAASLELEEEAPEEDGSAEMSSRGRLLNMSAVELVEAAENFLRRRDYYSAHYYATLAGQVDPQLDSARRLAAEAWNRIGEAEFSQRADESGELFRRKRAAYSQLTRGNTIEAYYRFRELKQEYPLDADISTFSRIALEELRGESFFIDELEHANPIPGRHRILFLNRSTPELRELVYFDRFVPLGSIGYAYGVEIIALGPGGGVLYQLTSPAGKVVEGSGREGEPAVHLMLRAIDRTMEGIRYEPELIAGEEQADHPAVRPLATKVGTITGFSLAETSLKLHRIPELLALRPGYADRGYHSGAIEIELVSRLMRPFGLLIFCFLSVGLGWMLRVRGRRRWYHYLLIAVVPAVVFLLGDLYIYGSRLLYLYFILQAGMALTLVFMILVQAVFLALALILVAAQSTHEAP